MVLYDALITIFYIGVVISVAVFLYVFCWAMLENTNMKIQQATQDCIDTCRAIPNENLTFFESRQICDRMTYDEYKCCGQAPEGNWSICKVRGDK